MKEIRFQHEYSIGDEVWYATSEGDRGIILDISFSVRKQEVLYRVTFGRDGGSDDIWCLNLELTKEKVLV